MKLILPSVGVVTFSDQQEFKYVTTSHRILCITSFWSLTIAYW